MLPPRRPPARLRQQLPVVPGPPAGPWVAWPLAPRTDDIAPRARLGMLPALIPVDQQGGDHHDIDLLLQSESSEVCNCLPLSD